MSVLFSSSELVQIAIGIEKRGAAFYDSLAESTGNVMSRNTYQHLADNEREHLKLFQNMSTSISEPQPPETYTEEYDLYLKALVDY